MAISGTISSALNFAGYRLGLSNLAIHNAARIFKLEEFKNTTLSSIIREPLWRTSHSAEAGLLKRVAIAIGVFTGFTTLYTLIGVALETVLPVGTVVINSLGLVSKTYVYLDESNMLVTSCMEVLPRFDRIFWYGDQRVEQKHVRATPLYYLKIHLQVSATLTKRLYGTKKISQMEPILAKVIDEYCYRRDRKLWRKPSWTTAKADTEQSTEP